MVKRHQHRKQAERKGNACHGEKGAPLAAQGISQDEVQIVAHFLVHLPVGTLQRTCGRFIYSADADASILRLRVSVIAASSIQMKPTKRVTGMKKFAG
jgi:hypothetical protein